MSALHEVLRHGVVPDLVLVEAALPESGLRFLEFLETHEGSRPSTVFIAGRVSVEEETALSLTGAAGYLVKPVTASMVRRVVFQATRGPSRDNCDRFACASAVSAILLDGDGKEVVTWPVRNLSRSGAMVETDIAIPLDSSLALRLRAGSAQVDVAARVVRVQNPCWEAGLGIGIRFDRVNGRLDSELTRLVNSLRRPTGHPTAV